MPAGDERTPGPPDGLMPSPAPVVSGDGASASAALSNPRPHELQNALSSGFSAPQFLQVTGGPPLFARTGLYPSHSRYTVQVTEQTVLTFDSDGLIPAVVQDARTNEVLILASMNQESIARSLATGRATFWSKSRNELWEKGATSGNWLEVVSISKNCEANSLLVRVRPTGPACHTGNRSCYYRPLEPERDILPE